MLRGQRRTKEVKEGEAEEGAEKKTNERRMIKGRGRAGDEQRVYRGNIHHEIIFVSCCQTQMKQLRV